MFVASIESLDGVPVDRGCLTYETVLIGVARRDPIADLSSGGIEIPARGGANAYVSLVPCSGPLAPGRYKLRWGHANRDPADPEERLPAFHDSQLVDDRAAAGAGDHFDRYAMRVGTLMRQERWDDADRVLDEAILALPMSADLYHFRALVSEERSDAANARFCAARAVSLIEERADAMLFERRSEREIAQQLRLYRAHLARLHGGGPRE